MGQFYKLCVVFLTKYTVLWNTSKADRNPMKYHFTYILMCLSTLIFAQTIPNGDFEQWEVRDHFKLSGWYSPTRNVERTADSKEGSYALKLINTFSETSNGTVGYARNLDYNNKQEINGAAVSGDALSISFWCKYDLAIGDTARFNVVLREKGTYKGKVDFKFTGNSAGNFVKFSIPIEWNSSGNRTIDSAWLYLYSYIENVVDGDGYVIYDDIAFENIGQRVGTFENSGFEDWYNVGVEFPKEWRSIDLLVYDTYTSFLSTPSCSQGSETDAHTGDYALVIQNYRSGTKVQRGYAFLGEENNDYYTPHIPFTDTFKYLQGYYKFLPDGPDTARINIRTYATDGGTRSNNNLYISEAASEWTFFSMPLSYNSTFTPDSAALIFYSGNDDGGEYGLDTKLFLDNLSFAMKPTPLKLSIEEVQSDINYYPNPVNDLLSITSTGGTYTINDLTGKTVANGPLQAGLTTINTSLMSSGLYFIHITNINQQWTQKIIKQ